MSAFVTALDSYTPLQLGENMHAEHGWSNDIKERVVQVFFQLTRTDNKTTMLALQNKFQALINQLAIRTDDEGHALYVTLIKLAAQTRDIEAGKGEYRLGWYLINAFEKAGQQNVAQKLIYWLVHNLPSRRLKEYTGCETEPSSHPLGSWKDIKYLWTEFEWSKETAIFMIRMMNEQVRRDITSVRNGKDPESLCGRWVPRESSNKFKLMFRALAQDYFSNYIESAKMTSNRTCVQTRVQSAKRKAYKDYRSILSTLNRALNTVQVNQCAGTWADINYEKSVTSVTLSRQANAFRNLTKKGGQRSNARDRIEGARKFEEWLSDKVASGETVKGSRVGINAMVRAALECPLYNTSIQNQLNLQWEDGGKKIGDLNDMVAIVDTSGSMYGDPLHAALGLGIRVAEKSSLGRRVITFSSTPTWHQLPPPNSEGKTDFVNDVKQLLTATPGLNTNFTATLKLILGACVEKQLTNEQVSKMVVAIFSDMQIDYVGNESLTNDMWQHIESEYKKHGYTKVPHILFWNLRSSEGFPVISTQKNATMFSGFSPALLNAFCEKGMDFLEASSPYEQMLNLLNNPRYAIFDTTWTGHHVIDNEHYSDEKEEEALKDYKFGFSDGNVEEYQTGVENTPEPASPKFRPTPESAPDFISHSDNKQECAQCGKSGFHMMSSMDDGCTYCDECWAEWWTQCGREQARAEQAQAEFDSEQAQAEQFQAEFDAEQFQRHGDTGGVPVQNTHIRFNNLYPDWDTQLSNQNVTSEGSSGTSATWSDTSPGSPSDFVSETADGWGSSSIIETSFGETSPGWR